VPRQGPRAGAEHVKLVAYLDGRQAATRTITIPADAADGEVQAPPLRIAG